MHAEFWLRVAGILTWIVCGIPAGLAATDGDLAGATLVLWALAFAVFGIAFWLHTKPLTTYSHWLAVTFLGLESAAGLVMVALTGETLSAATLVVVAGQMPFVLPARAAVSWVGVQSVTLAAIFWWMDGMMLALVVGGAFAGFQVFAIAAALLARSESVARQNLAAANAELRAARELLAENTRVAERLRISRDLHDTLGHHLTALSLQLDVASRLANGQAAQHVREAHAITRLLLGDVRDVVSRVRDRSEIDLTQALHALASGISRPAVHLDLPDKLKVGDRAQADALLRCVQELITNAARHSSARNLWIRLSQRPDGVELHARDDGRGAGQVIWGHGLTGMRERFEASAGTIELSSHVGAGFEIRAFLPRPEADA